LTATLAQLPRLGFLGLGRFAAKACGYERWISLEFLGFPRPKRDLSRRYAGFSLEVFFIALYPRRSQRRRREWAILGYERAELFIEQA
jgi:hypothetical protein